MSQPNQPKNAAHADQPAPTEGAESLHHLEAQRRANRDQVSRELNMAVYGERTDNLLTLSQARAKYDEGADKAYNEAVAAAKAAAPKPAPGTPAQPAPASVVSDQRPRARTAGRVILSRDGGKLLWFTLIDDTGEIQIACSQRDCDEKSFKLAKFTERGDIVVVEGPLMKTKTGEITIWASSLSTGAKCLATPPEKHAGLADPELRYRQRYVDMWVNPETASVFVLRSKIVSRIREFMSREQYLEVETPMLQTLAGGAAARPFVTHMNALDIKLFMRIAPELYLKRLLVGGMRRVYEINRNFRNEGLDKQHNPEFTMLEAYQAFGDVMTVMDLTERLIRDAATMVAQQRGHTMGDVVLPFGELNVNYSQPFRRVSYGELFKNALGFDMTDEARVVQEAQQRHIKTKTTDGKPISTVLIVNELFEEFAEKSVDPSVPTFITDYPAAISPLTRPKKDNPSLADRADLFIAGMEIAPHYTELNDPDIQAAKFREQLQGADEGKSAEEQTFRTFDQDFIDALKVGMPPAGGMGLGIDRLVMLLTNQRTIRDVVLFPLMKPVANDAAREAGVGLPVR
jgi:lysyl-tRNA synthetase class 2